MRNMRLQTSDRFALNPSLVTFAVIAEEKASLHAAANLHLSHRLRSAEACAVEFQDDLLGPALRTAFELTL